jgi:hypothetical protein
VVPFMPLLIQLPCQLRSRPISFLASWEPLHTSHRRDDWTILSRIPYQSSGQLHFGAIQNYAVVAVDDWTILSRIPFQSSGQLHFGAIQKFAVVAVAAVLLSALEW